VDTHDNLYFCDGNNRRIRKIDASTGIITTIAGNGTSGYNGDSISATSASLILPSGVCVDTIGNVYICDISRVRKIDTFGIITTIIGNGSAGFSGDGGPAINAQIQASRVYIDPWGDIVLVDYYRVRRVNKVTGIINTIAGTGLGLYNGDGIQALSANMNVVALAWDAEGRMYIADLGNDRVRMIDLSGIIHTIAGTGTAGFSGDGGPATLAEMFDPTGVAFDTCWNLYIPSKENHRIRKVTFHPDCWPTSIKETTPLAFTLSPNPATATLTITSNNKLKQLTLRSTLGHTLLHQTCNTNKATLSIETLPAGIYFINITDATGHQRTEKLIKQ
jgi:sugar lactone lactonase YvrE